MMGKPKITINKFANMGDDGVFWLQNMETRKLNGNTILSPAWKSTFMFSEDTTGFSGMTSAFYGLCPWSAEGSYSQEVLGFTGSKIISFDPTFYNTASYNRGLIHTIASLTLSSYPSILATQNNNVLYSSEQYVGIGYKLQATGATATSVTVTGTNFATLGVDKDSAMKRKCYNLTKKEEYTITSVNGTDNDTINFSAPPTAPQANDYIMVFIDNKFDYGCGSGVSYSFDGQSAPISWIRQMIYWKGAGAYYALNGNYLAKLNSDESTWSATHKQLPIATQGYCMGINQDRILIGGEQNHKGVLLMWDSYSSGWLSILELTGRPTSIYPYKTGWLVLVNGIIYYTDGYSLQRITNLPDISGRTRYFVYEPMMVVCNDKIVVAVNNASTINRLLDGIYIYDFNYGWTYSPAGYDSKFGEANITSMVLLNDSVKQVIIYSGDTLNNNTTARFVSNLNENTATNYSAMFYVKLPQKMNLSIVELNLSAQIPFKFQETPSNITVTVSYGEGKGFFTTNLQAGNGSTTTSVINASGATYPAKEGQLIVALRGEIAGERTYITTIANAGTATETLTVSPAFSASPYKKGSMKRMDLRKAGSLTIPANEIPTELNVAIPNFYSDKLFLEVHFSAPTAQLDLHGINIY